MAKSKRPVTIRRIDIDPKTLKAKIFDVSFDALISEDQSYEAEVPEYPTESGFNVSDTIIIKPLSLSMTLFVTNTPITWVKRGHGGVGWIEATVEKLKGFYFAKKPVTVITSDKTYYNMAIVNFSLSKSFDTGYAREIPLTFQEIRTTSSKTTTIPESYGKSGKSGTSAGIANTTESTAGQATSESGNLSSLNGLGGSSTGAASGESANKASILYNLASNAGVF